MTRLILACLLLATTVEAAQVRGKIGPWTPVGSCADGSLLFNNGGFVGCDDALSWLFNTLTIGSATSNGTIQGVGGLYIDGNGGDVNIARGAVGQAVIGVNGARFIPRDPSLGVTCPPNWYFVFADAASKKLKKCEDGVVSDL